MSGGLEATLDQVVALKDKGNWSYKGKQHQAAIDQYLEAMDTLETAQAMDIAAFGRHSPHAATIEELARSLMLNLAACHLALDKHDDTIMWCDKVLAVQPHHTKALFRRGQAYSKLGRHEEALADLKAAQQSDPGNADIRSKLRAAKEQEKRDANKEKDMYKGIFGLGTPVTASSSKIKNAPTPVFDWLPTPEKCGLRRRHGWSVNPDEA